MGRDEVAVAVAKARGQRRCKGDLAMSILAAKFWSFRIALKLRGITCTAQAYLGLPLKLKAPGKMKLELQASAASTL
jgi:hypothetical protein